MRQINRVAVLGAGVMGATIAAHLANAGLDVLLLDIVPKSLEPQEEAKGLTLESPVVRNRIARNGLQGLAKMKPAPLYSRDYAGLMTVGNFEDDLDKLNSCDWIIEVVVEYMPIKLDLFKKIVPHLAPGAILSTNTSGLSVNEMAEVLPPEVKKNFLVTHFFNPPRYMRLMELVPCAETDPVVMEMMAEFIGKRLGKGIVYAKDTTNFIANRIGVYSIYKSIQHMTEMGMTVEEVDAVAGPASGRAKSAAFRTSDLVGLDVLAHVGTNNYELVPDDEEREVFKLPSFIKKMIENGQLGNKAGQGFYKRGKLDGKKQIFYFDYTSGDYKPLEKPKFASVAAVKQVDDPAKKLKMVVSGADKGAEFAWKSTRDTLIYAFNRIPEIADDVVNVDNAMRWGFNWEIGPFEMLDAIGVKEFVGRAEQDGVAVPAILKEIDSFYRYGQAGQKEYFDLQKKDYVPVPVKEGQIQLEILKKANGVVDKNADASVVDLGDGVFCLEFHSKMNSISGGILAMTHKAVKRAETEGVGLVVANQGSNFSVGANLMMLAVAVAEGAWDDVAMQIKAFQNATMALKYAKVPVVAAPFGMTLGGGAEFCLHSDAINAHAETYMGLVEVGVGLLPGGGGTKEMSIRAIELAAKFKTDVQPFIIKNFQQIAMAKVSMGASELYGMDYMRHGDSITMDIDTLIGDAKQKVLGLAVNYRPKSPAAALPAPGRSIAGAVKSQLWNMKMGNFISDYDELVAGYIVDVMCGGDVASGTLVTEEYLLQLEREYFLKLCGNRKTGERIQHMLKTGKPLRN
ncbi:3-hydroxyacyl-CoA dehydrogenase/enoyl-CoA hydratase family protein [Desulforhopalus singaporensis]|uniref:3-hydroxyacyl-CoA dehydrogenase n=1 Tax=Desulforhopalus singaporensis TaxID=91360 RepID=A0A1H0SRA9_9BACT|nr:3-hydroxyacyl-CoA dehydrogenase/enoyl-CoA hydratase family protein [Desulforhopalus singaporensis]SDP44274.1 3-hydroxyacyl-CoA dehydrogenase [Desulforhopalus singaporensis]